MTTTPGELNDNQEAEAAGLNSFGIGEAMDPVGVVSLLEAAEDIEQTGEGQFTASVTLPVDGADAMIESVYGRPQDELEGLTIPIDVDIDDDGAIRVVVVYDFDAAMSFLDDDPQASALAGIKLRNRTRYLRPGADPAILGPDSAARDLATLLDQLR